MTDVPPPVRAGPTRRPRWASILLLVLGAWAVLLGISAVIAIFVPTHTHHDRRFSCMSNLAQLAGVFVVGRAEGSDLTSRPRSGPALFLSWRKDGTWIRPGQEGILICPGDNSVAAPDTPEARARYDDVDLDHPPADLCSYAVRDFERFPLDPSAAELQVLAACVGRVDAGGWHACHRGGIVVAWDDGSSRFVEWTELGVGPPDTWPAGTPVVGPGSPVPLLRPLLGPEK